MSLYLFWGDLSGMVSVEAHVMGMKYKYESGFIIITIIISITEENLKNGEAHLGGRKICWWYMWDKKITGCFMYEPQSVAGTPLSHCDLTELILPFSK